MDDSELGRVDDAATPEGFALGYPEGRKLPGGPPGGWMGQLRTMPNATADTIKYASRMWTQARPEDFERTGHRRYVDRATGTRTTSATATRSWRRPGGGRRVLRRGRRALVPAPGRPARGAEPDDGHDGREVMRRRDEWAEGIQTSGLTSVRSPQTAGACRDWAYVESRYRRWARRSRPRAHAPLQGFRLFPGQRAPLTQGSGAGRDQGIEDRLPPLMRRRES